MNRYLHLTVSGHRIGHQRTQRTEAEDSSPGSDWDQCQEDGDGEKGVWRAKRTASDADVSALVDYAVSRSVHSRSSIVKRRGSRVVVEFESPQLSLFNTWSLLAGPPGRQQTTHGRLPAK